MRELILLYSLQLATSKHPHWSREVEDTILSTSTQFNCVEVGDHLTCSRKLLSCTCPALVQTTLSNLNWISSIVAWSLDQRISPRRRFGREKAKEGVRSAITIQLMCASQLSETFTYLSCKWDS